MKAKLLSLCLVTCCPLAEPSIVLAAEKKAAPVKSAADMSFDAFNKVRTAGGAKDQARFQQVIVAGLGHLTQYPTHGRAGEVVNGLAFYANGIDAKQPAMRTAYLSFLKLEVTNLRYKEGVRDEAKAALAAVDAAMADFEVRDAFNPANLTNLREKIDALAEAPGGGRFLPERERSYAHILIYGTTFARAEEHLKKLIGHKDKGIAGMARTELNLLEVKKQPFGLKFTGFDGKEVDFAQLRGKVVALYFWSAANKGSQGNFEGFRRLHSDYRKRGFEVVTVCYDKAEDREKVAAAIKEHRLAWPVHFDGQGAKNETMAKLNVTSVPALLLFDQKGILQHTMQGMTLTSNLPLNQLEPQVRRLLGVK